MNNKKNYGWVGTIQQFLFTDPNEVLRQLIEILDDSENNISQIVAWKDCLNHLYSVLAQYSHPQDYIIFEYIIPRSGLSRPDVLIIQRGINPCLKVIEFKSYLKIEDAEKWQLRLYTKKLKLYHEVCYKTISQVDGILLSTSLDVAQMSIKDEEHQILIVGIARLLESLEEGRSLSDVNNTSNLLDEFLNATYKPSPAITQSARILFKKRQIPKISTIESSNFSDVLQNVEEIIHEAQSSQSHHLVLVHGEPGAGKTFLGLSIAHTNYQDSKDKGDIVYLSGNEPLVEVLANLTDDRFVQHLYKYKGDYKDTARNPVSMPNEQIIIFDEAQRAWDKEKVAYNDLSEPDIILDIATQKSKPWSVTIALIGHGQEIKGGEEAGLVLWAEAVNKINKKNGVQIKIHGSKDLDVFEQDGLSHSLIQDSNLYLDSSLRHHDAQKYHEFVNAFLDGNLELARAKYQQLLQHYLLFYTDDIDLAKQHLTNYARNIQDGRFQYGAIYSSTASKIRYFKEFAYKSKFEGMNTYVVYHNYEQLKHEPYFEKYPNSKLFFSNHLVYAASEYQCQGLELDMTLVVWGDDLIWENDKWVVRERTSKHKDPHSYDAMKLILNTYRVLLTRGRDATIIYTGDPKMLKLFEELGIRSLEKSKKDLDYIA
ncbi:DNA/RNA helicase domain-containing protein [Acinetobacter terrestris]|uniref:DNA/RNA helicase domain-containing protein n=1 Tax=Acinetobacter terrestris TaxID=2529843 RepID=UPI003523573A